MRISALDQGLGLCESIADLAAAWGKRMQPQHRKAILDFQRLLAAHAPDVRWTLVGAVAVMGHLTEGRQRTTSDVDAVIELDDVKAFIEAVPLAEYNFRPGRKSLAVYVELIHEPEGTPFQLMHPRLADIPGLFERTEIVPITGGSAPIAAPEHLLIMKVRSLGSTTRSPGKRATDRGDSIYLLADNPESQAAAEALADPNERLAIADIARDAEIERNMPDYPA